MSTYHVELPGKLSLAKQSKAIAGEESLGAKFVGARIWVNSKNAITNLAEFEEIDDEPEEPLKPPTLSTTLPSDVTPEWAGSLIVDGSAVQQVYLTRS
jgi:hypothetical protein